MCIKKIIFSLLVLILVGCSQPIESPLNKDDIFVQILHHQFDECELVGFIVTITNDQLSKEDLFVRVDGLDSFCNINQELTNNPLYTTDYVKDKIILDEDYINFVYYYVVESNYDLSHNLLNKIEVSVSDGIEIIEAKDFVLTSI